MSAKHEKSPGAVGAARGAEVVELSRATPSDTASQPRRQRAIRAIGPAGLFTVTGQSARALMALVAAGEGGVTAFEVAGWAYRLGAYVFDLRYRHGLAIETLREPHEGGWHARYVLRSPVRIEELFGSIKERAAA